MTTHEANGWLFWGASLIAAGTLIQTAIAVMKMAGRGEKFERRIYTFGWSTLATGASMTAVGAGRLYFGSEETSAAESRSLGDWLADHGLDSLFSIVIAGLLTGAVAMYVLRRTIRHERGLGLEAAHVAADGRLDERTGALMGAVSALQQAVGSGADPKTVLVKMSVPVFTMAHEVSGLATTRAAELSTAMVGASRVLDRAMQVHRHGVTRESRDDLMTVLTVMMNMSLSWLNGAARDEPVDYRKPTAAQRSDWADALAELDALAAKLGAADE